MKYKFSAILCVFLLLGLLNPVSGAPASTVPEIYYVAPGGDCAGAGPCFSSPQAAVDAAVPGSVVRIAAGTYTLPAGSGAVLSLSKSLTILGGYRLTNWYDPQPFTYASLLDGQGLGGGVRLAGTPGAPLEVTLEGLQIRNGAAAKGAGVNGSDVHLTLKRCVIRQNQASEAGGGVFLNGASSLNLSYSQVINNSAGTTGGGLNLEGVGAESLVERTWIFGNTAVSGGGGLSLSGGALGLKTLMLVDNHVSQGGAPGAGLLANGSAVTLEHVTLARNTGGAGEGMRLSGSSVLTAHNLLAAGQTAALSLISPSSGTLDGVLWGSGTTWANGANTSGTGTLTIQHAYSGDPVFSGLDSSNLKTFFHIGETSPARDRSVLTAADYNDIDGLPATGTADLGADEYRSAVIRVTVEPGGNVEKGEADGTPENNQGAFFWNGTQWTTNDSWGHIAYIDAGSLERLKQYHMAAEINSSSPAGLEVGKYHVARSSYTYWMPARGGGLFKITATQYRISHSTSQEVILLNSRGNGLGQASFDVFVQSTAGTTIAFRSGGAWFNYPDAPEQAALRPINEASTRAGMITTCDKQAVDHSRYWLDMNGGSDMGGITYSFHAVPQSSERVRSLGGCFVDAFWVKFMNETNNLEEFRLSPEVMSETYVRALYLPVIRH